jgi:hypothetical protein
VATVAAELVPISGRTAITILCPRITPRIAVLAALSRQARIGLVEQRFDRSQFHPQGADTGHGVVTMQERHGQGELVGV